MDNLASCDDQSGIGNMLTVKILGVIVHLNKITNWKFQNIQIYSVSFSYKKNLPCLRGPHLKTLVFIALVSPASLFHPNLLLTLLKFSMQPTIFADLVRDI